jgi:hypothetical protein
MWGCQETLNLEEDEIKANLKVQLHLFHTVLSNLNANLKRCLLFYKEAIIFLYPFLPFFPSVLKKKVPLLSKAKTSIKALNLIPSHFP